MRPCINFVGSTNLFMRKTDKWYESMKNKKSTIIYVDFTCEFCGLTKHTTKSTATAHIKYCKFNPNRMERKPHPPITDEARKKMSESAKKAFKNGNHATWKSRSKCKHSYPEQWFISVINNEFEDKSYTTELSVGKWFLDFAWIDKMRYIEIDGQQHQRYIDRIESDQEKDKFCKKLGWSCLRLSWEFILNNKAEAIKIAKDFIDNGKISDIKWESKYQIKEKRRNSLISLGKIDRSGRPNVKKLPEEDWLKRKNLILNCGVDLLSFGWKEAVQKATGLTRKQVNLTIDKFYDDFKNLIFIRN